MYDVMDIHQAREKDDRKSAQTERHHISAKTATRKLAEGVRSVYPSDKTFLLEDRLS